MPENLHLIWVLAVSLGMASVLGYLAHRLKVSPIIAYLLAGYMVGPNSPGLTADQTMADQLAIIGVTLLMFVVGLNFNWKDIGSVKKIVVPGALLTSALSILAGCLFILYLGGTINEGFVVGVGVCVSSTVVVVRILTDQGLLHTRQGHIVIGWTIVEDLISVFGLLLLPVVASTAVNGGAPSFNEVAATLLVVILKIVALGAVLFLFVEKGIEKILQIFARTRSHELFTVAILAAVFLLALSCAYLFGISLALGAFIAGTVVGKTDMSHQAAANALPMRDAFAVLFFISVGMLFNPLVLADNLPLLAGLLAIILLLRPLIAYLCLKAARYPSYIGFSVATAICQIGEYSFIIADEGYNLKILPENAFDVLIACAFISIVLSSVGFKLLSPWIKPKRHVSESDVDEGHLDELSAPTGPLESFLPRALVVGYGPVGRAVAKALRGQYQVLVIEQNIDTVSTGRMQDKEVEMLYGDATQTQLLLRAAAERIELAVITLPDAHISRAVIRALSDLNPHVDIIARAHFLADYEQARDKFGDDIPFFCDEVAVAEQMIAAIKARAS